MVKFLYQTKARAGSQEKAEDHYVQGSKSFVLTWTITTRQKRITCCAFLDELRQGENATISSADAKEGGGGTRQSLRAPDFWSLLDQTVAERSRRFRPPQEVNTCNHYSGAEQEAAERRKTRLLLSPEHLPRRLVTARKPLNAAFIRQLSASVKIFWCDCSWIGEIFCARNLTEV